MSSTSMSFCPSNNKFSYVYLLNSGLKFKDYLNLSYFNDQTKISSDAPSLSCRPCDVFADYNAVIDPLASYSPRLCFEFADEVLIDRTAIAECSEDVVIAGSPPHSLKRRTPSYIPPPFQLQQKEYHSNATSRPASSGHSFSALAGSVRSAKRKNVDEDDNDDEFSSDESDAGSEDASAPYDQIVRPPNSEGWILHPSGKFWRTPVGTFVCALPYSKKQASPDTRCLQVYGQINIMIEHFKGPKHKDKGLFCSACGNSFMRADVLKRHCSIGCGEKKKTSQQGD